MAITLPSNIICLHWCKNRAMGTKKVTQFNIGQPIRSFIFVY